MAKTIPIFNIASRTLTITFEETDGLRVISWLDTIIALQRNALPYVVGIRVKEFNTRFNKIVSDKYYKCVLSTYDEPAFSRTGGPGIVAVSATFNIMSEQPWSQNLADAHDVGRGKAIEDDAGLTTALAAATDNTQPVKPLVENLTQWTNEFKDAYEAGKKDEQASSTTEHGNTVPTGVKVAGKGAAGVSDVKGIQAAGAAEVYGTNGMGRKEGSKNAVYFNKMDEGKQAGKLNFGAGNTQVFLEGTDLKNTQLTIINAKTGEKLTGTMDQLTKQLSSRSDANSSQSQWKMDDVSAQKVEDIALGKVARNVQRNVDADILKAMDTDTLGGLFHQEYGSGGSTAATGRYLRENKAAALEDLRKNNGKFSEEFANKMAASLGANMRKETKNSYVDRTKYFTGRTGYAVSHKHA